MVCQFWNLLPLHLNRKDKLNGMIQPWKTVFGKQMLMIYNSFKKNVCFNLSKCLFIFAIPCLYISVLSNRLLECTFMGLAVIPKLHVTSNALYNHWSQMVCKLVKLGVGFLGRGLGEKGRGRECRERLLTNESIYLSLYICTHTELGEFFSLNLLMQLDYGLSQWLHFVE